MPENASPPTPTAAPAPGLEAAPSWVVGNLPSAKSAEPVETVIADGPPPTPVVVETPIPAAAETAPVADALPETASPLVADPPLAEVVAPTEFAEPEETSLAAGPLVGDVTLDLEAQLEALLFVADGPVAVGRLAEALEVPPRQVEAALQTLAENYVRRGLSLQRTRDKV